MRETGATRRSHMEATHFFGQKWVIFGVFALQKKKERLSRGSDVKRGKFFGWEICWEFCGIFSDPQKGPKISGQFQSIFRQICSPKNSFTLTSFCRRATLTNLRLVVSNLVVCNFTRKHSFAPFCALLETFADLRCALLRAFACFCVLVAHLETPIALHSVARRVSHQIPAESEMSRQNRATPPQIKVLHLSPDPPVALSSHSRGAPAGWWRVSWHFWVPKTDRATLQLQSHQSRYSVQLSSTSDRI